MTVLEYVEEYGVQSGLGAALVDRESDRTINQQNKGENQWKKMPNSEWILLKPC